MRRVRHLVTVLVPVLLLLAGILLEGAGGAVAGTTTRSGVTVGAKVGFSNGHEILWMSDADLEADLDGMAASGARWLRVDFDWPSVQAGGRDRWNWTHIDRVVRGARSRGLRVLAMPAYTPTWARPAGTPDKSPPTDPADYARFVRAAVARYRPLGVRHWEIWNEPNHSMFWYPQPSLSGYARLFKAAADAIHAEDPGATVITGGLAPAADVPGHTVAPATFVAGIYRRGVGPHLDAVGMHPYTFPYAPQYAADWNPFYRLPAIHRIMTRRGDGAKRIWATEVGFGTGSSSRAVSEATQASYARKMVDAWVDYPFAANIFWYSYRDHGTDRSDVWKNMGLVRRDWDEKPSRDAFAETMSAPI